MKFKFISLDNNCILDWYASHFITMNAHLPYNCTLRNELVITHTLSSTWKVFWVSCFIILVVLDSQRNVVTWHIICTHIIIVFSESMATKKKRIKFSNRACTKIVSALPPRATLRWSKVKTNFWVPCILLLRKHNHILRKNC